MSGLEALGRLVGAWETEAKHPMLEGAMRGRRDAPGFSQRFAGMRSEDGNMLHGQWELSTDDLTWTDDLKITYRRVSG